MFPFGKDNPFANMFAEFIKLISKKTYKYPIQQNKKK